MRPLGLVQSLLRQEKTSENRTIAFRPGQIFSGKVLKLYPNQIAEVQVGSQKVIAHLETPLSVDDRHWFQVQAGQGKVHLRVLETSSGTSKSPSVDSLLSQLNLPVSKNNISLVQLFIREQFPISKETIENAIEWLKLSDSLQEGLQVIKLLLSKQLPFTKDVFLSLSSVLKDEPLSTQLTNLQLLLKNEQSTPSNSKLLALLNEMNMTGIEKETNAVFRRIVHQLLFANEKSNTAFNLLQNLGFISKTASHEEIVNQVFARTLNNNNHLHTLNSGKSIAEQHPEFHSQLAREIYRSLNANMNTAGNQSENIIQSFLSISSKHADEGFRQLAAAITAHGSSYSKTLPNDEQSMLTRMKNEVQMENIQWGNSLAIKDLVKSMIKGLGLTYEHDIVNFLKQHEGESVAKLEMLKPLLMQLLGEEASIPMKEAAERLLYKITGFQVLSQEAGPIMQFVFQIPLSFSDRRTDLTMQWSGRKTKDGKIDPNYCRVMFYLHLDFIEETIVDMQVQNRIMNISIINERNDLKWLASPFLAQLKEGLTKINYQLSSVSFDMPAKEKQKNDMRDTLAAIVVPNQVSGVDYRI